MNKKIIKILLCIVIAIYFTFSMFACVNEQDMEEITWLSPMLSLTLDANKCEQGTYMASVYDGDIEANAGSPAPANERGMVTTEGITASTLTANGAIKATMNFAYLGEETYNVRFRAAITRVLWDETANEGAGDWKHPNVFGGSYEDGVRPAAHADILMLCQYDSKWWNIRTAALGGANTGGLEYTIIGISSNTATLLINKTTASDYDGQDFYIVGLTEGRYVITYYMEAPDYVGHFHGYNIIASTSAIITVA